MIERCLAVGINPGLALDDEGCENGLLVAITEQRTRADIDRLVAAVGDAVAAERPTATLQEVGS